MCASEMEPTGSTGHGWSSKGPLYASDVPAPSINKDQLYLPKLLGSKRNVISLDGHM